MTTLQVTLMSLNLLVVTSSDELDGLEEEFWGKGVVILHRQDDSAEATVLATNDDWC